MARNWEFTPDQALKLVQSYKGSPTLQAEFGSFQRYVGYVEGMLVGGTRGGQLPAELSGVFPEWTAEQTLAVNKRWKEAPRLRAEFRENFEVYHAFVWAVTAGRAGSTLPFELADIFPDVPVDAPPSNR